MNWKNIEFRENGSIKVPNNWVYPYFYEGLNILFRLENTLRVFVYSVLKNELSDGWLNVNLSRSDNDNTTISAISKQRISQDEKFGYLGYKVENPVMYLTSGELISIILNKPYWPFFNRYFPADQTIIKIKLDEIGTIRNSLAHFRPLKFEDIGVLRQNSIQILSGVNNYINSMLNCNQLVPTNTPDDWYKKIKAIETQENKITLRQSLDGEWLRIEFNYTSTPIATKSLSSGFITVTYTKLITPAILNLNPQITNVITYSSEIGPFPINNYPNELIKSVQFTVGKKTFIKEYETITERLVNVFAQIRSEDELLKSDNLAKGDLIEAANINVVMKDNNWNADPSPLKCIDIQGVPLEYWGDFFMFGDFITSTVKFPWMPVNISNYDF